MNSLVKKICICALLAVIAAQAGAAGQSLNKVVAVVNGEVITSSELYNYTTFVTAEMRMQQGMAVPPAEQLKQQILNRMVVERIQMQIAKQSGIEVDSFTVTQALQDMVRQQGTTLEAFKREIESRGVNFNDYRELVRAELTMQSLHAREIAQDITVAKHEVESFLNSSAGQDQSGTEYQLGHILLATTASPTPEALQKLHAEAEQLVKDLRNGSDFSKAAMTKSAGRQALNGGDLGWRRSGEVPTLFENYVPTMQKGDVVGPIRSTSGMHIIKLIDKRSRAKEISLETHVRQILIAPSANLSANEAKIIATGIHQQLLQGADFAKLAEKNSHDKRSASKGGDLGWVTEGLVPDAFAKAMHGLKNGEISSPFLTEEGWTIAQVIDRRSLQVSDEAAWNRAMGILSMRKKNEAIDSWVRRVRDDAQVEILLADAK